LFILGWIVPILLAIFVAVAFEVEQEVLYIASASPIILVVLSIGGILPDAIQSDEFQIIRNSYWFGTLCIFLFTAVLGFQLKEMKIKTNLKIEEQARQS